MSVPAQTEHTKGWIRLFHGTDLASASDIIANGLNVQKASQFNGSGEFWATTDREYADVFAQANPAGGTPARLEFEVPQSVLSALMNAKPPELFQDGRDSYEFTPASIPTLNPFVMTGRVVTPVP